MLLYRHFSIDNIALEGCHINGNILKLLIGVQDQLENLVIDGYLDHIALERADSGKCPVALVALGIVSACVCLGFSVYLRRKIEAVSCIVTVDNDLDILTGIFAVVKIHSTGGAVPFGNIGIMQIPGFIR